MINQLRIRNLRSLQDTEVVEIRPIMILLGANSSGKSTFLRSFPLFTQSVNKKLRGPISWFDSAYVDFGDFKTAMNRYSDENEGISFSYAIDKPIVDPVRFIFKSSSSVNKDSLQHVDILFNLNGDSKGTYISKIHIKTHDVDYKISLKERNDNVDINLNGKILEIPERLKLNFNTAFAILPKLILGSTSDENENSIIKKLIGIFKKHCNKKLQNTQRLESILSFDLLDKTSFLRHLKAANGIRSFQRSIQNWTTDTIEFNSIYNYFLLLKFNPIIDVINRELASFYHKCDYIAPMRAEAGRYYRIQGLQVQSVDPTGHNLLEFIASLTPKEKSSYDEFVKNILKITVDVPSESGMKSIRIKGQNGDFSIADVGFGYSQILPVITKLWHTSYIINLYNSNSYYSRLRFRELDKSIILMEQPELHLHPAMQAKIADAFIKTVDITRKSETPSTLIIETHSQAIINRIGRRIREGKICPEDINVLLFQKDEKLQNTMIKQITFSNEGQLKNWPYGFFDPED